MKLKFSDEYGDILEIGEDENANVVTVTTTTDDFEGYPVHQSVYLRKADAIRLAEFLFDKFSKKDDFIIRSEGEKRHICSQCGEEVEKEKDFKHCAGHYEWIDTYYYCKCGKVDHKVFDL